MAVPNIFANVTTTIPLSQLDANFATAITLGNTAMYLGNTTTTLGNVTLTGATISNSPNANVTIGNTTVALGNTATTFGNVTLQNANITSVAATFPNSYLANSTTTLGNATLTLGSTTSTVGNLTLNNATINSVSTPITPAQGGTGLTTLTANNVLIGNGTSNVTFVAPGTTGNVLTSNGTSWVSQATSGGGNITITSTTTNATYYLGFQANTSGTTTTDYINTNITVNPNTGAITVPSISTNNTFGFKNRIINGAMMIDQRNAGATVTPSPSSSYSLDRWYIGQSQASSKLSFKQNQGAVTLPVGFSNYLGVTSNSAYTLGASDYFTIEQYIEGFNCSDLAWGTANAKTVTLSFQVYSSLTGTFGGVLYAGTGTLSYPFSYTISSANTWTSISVTITGPTTGTWTIDNSKCIAVCFGLGVGSTYSGTAGSWQASVLRSVTGATSVVGTNGATFYITGVQLEKGSTATSFDYRPYGTELALCQRYFQKYTNAYMGLTFNTASLNYGGLPLKVTMRSAPTLDAGASYSVAAGSAGTPAFQNAGTYNSTTTDVAQFYNSSNNWTGSVHCSVTCGLNSEL